MPSCTLLSIVRSTIQTAVEEPTRGSSWSDIERVVKIVLLGMSASENVVKEVQEEASLSVAAKRLYALRHKAKHGYPPDPRDFYKLLFLCEPLGEVSPHPGADVIEVGFFGLEELPPLSMSRTIADDVTAAFASRNESSACSFRLKGRGCVTGT